MVLKLWVDCSRFCLHFLDSLVIVFLCFVCVCPGHVYPFTGLDYWTGILDCTTGLSYKPLWKRFDAHFRIKSTFYIKKWLTTMEERNNDNCCLLQCFQ